MKGVGVWSMFCCLFFLSSCGENPSGLGDPQVSLGSIVGGEKTNTATFPFIVKVGSGCGGALVAPRWVLTAAHCVPIADKIHSATIWKSNLSWYGTSGEKDIDIEKIYYHARYNPVTTENDIALIYLSQALTEVDPNAKVVSMATAADTSRGAYQTGIIATVIGWGMTCESCFDYISYLRKVDIPLVDIGSANLWDSYDGKIKPGMIAAGVSSGGKDSCQGDSGGPLVVFDKEKNEYLQIGVTSWGEGCARAKKYGIYTNVAYFQNWIETVMAKH